MSKRAASYFFVAILCVAGMACKSNKALMTTPGTTPIVNRDTTTAPVASVLKTLDINENDFSFYQTRAKLNYREGSQQMEVDATIAMEKDQYIWMSVTAVLGIEAARILITRDSVQILDRLHKKYIVSDFNLIQKMTNTPLRLENLQRMMVGNPVFEQSVQKSVVDTLMGNLAVYLNLGAQKQNTFYNKSLKVSRSVIAENNQSREMRIDYDAFSTFGQNAYPNRMNINIRAEKNIECTLELNNFVFDKKREFQFTVPSGYEVVKP